MLYGTKCWAKKRYHAQKMSVADMHMFRWCVVTQEENVRNEDIRTKIGVASIEEKMRENRLHSLVICDVNLLMRQSGE